MSSASRLAKIRARLDLPTVRRASGLLGGHHRSIFTGHGQDFDDMVEYHPGDDVGDIDWKASARTGHPVIRRFVHERSEERRGGTAGRSGWAEEAEEGAEEE